MDTTKLGIEKKFMDMMGLKGFSEATKRSYSDHLGWFFNFKKYKHCSILSSQDVNDYLIHLNGRNLSTSYMNQAINSIVFLFKYVLNRKLKAYLVPRPKKAKTEPILLSDSETERYIGVITNKKHKAIICLLYGAGLRRSEVINLKIEHIDSSNMLIHIKSGKGKKDRSVMLDPFVLQVLREYYVEYKPKDYLFNGQDGLKYSASSIQQFVKKYGQLAEIKKKVHPHLFRHMFATGILENGGDIHDTQISLGHSTPTITANCYAHKSPKYLSRIKSPIANLNLKPLIPA